MLLATQNHYIHICPFPKSLPHFFIKLVPNRFLAINALTSDLVVILRGGSGTLSELQLAWEYGKDVMIYLGEANVGGKTSEALQKDFPDAKIGGDEQELRALKRHKK